ncbi:PTS sugar transporter subunit IIB, partial [Escherichia coli]|nr:PTS sugar transporter subunit IIB [Escherichia coli]
SRDSSSGAIAVCGMNEMLKYLPESDDFAMTYRLASHSILSSLIKNYTYKDLDKENGLLTHGVYSWHSGKGVDEANIWGDYFYMEALMRFYKNWKLYWEEEKKMTKPNIKMVRIDERLIHGQGQLWINSLGANLVIVANDEVSTSSIQQT